jgi:hypothetical protein
VSALRDLDDLPERANTTVSRVDDGGVLSACFQGAYSRHATMRCSSHDNCPCEVHVKTVIFHRYSPVSKTRMLLAGTEGSKVIHLF